MRAIKIIAILFARECYIVFSAGRGQPEVRSVTREFTVPNAEGNQNETMEDLSETEPHGRWSSTGQRAACSDTEFCELQHPLQENVKRRSTKRRVWTTGRLM